eukprot:m.1040995 g.1040995  ORF g.1040995 m.1040995 type:complete len:62 (+) comp24156_c0_seq7:402-587(+)
MCIGTYMKIWQHCTKVQCAGTVTKVVHGALGTTTTAFVFIGHKVFTRSQALSLQCSSANST